MHTILLVIQVLIAIAIIALVLIQHGEGADAGAAFGSGASGTVFGSQGSANFLSRATAVLAALFFAASLSLAYLVKNNGAGGGSSVVDRAQTHQPAKPAGTGQKQSGKSTGQSHMGTAPEQQPGGKSGRKPAQKPASRNERNSAGGNGSDSSNIPQAPSAGGSDSSK